ncbi:MAG: CoA transferase [Geminicoccaceae bacterium]
MRRLGLDAAHLRTIRPQLVYCAISGFGQDGPLSGNPAYDQIIQGMAGVMSVTGDRTSAPLRVGYPVADTMGGITAAFAIAAALVRARSTGEGETIDVSMLESTLVAMGWAVSNWLIAGREASPLGNENMTAAPSGTFRTGEGLLNIAANRQQQFESLCRLIDRPELIDHPDYADREDRKRNRDALRGEIERGLDSRTAAQWSTILNEAGVPAGEVLSVRQILDHPQVETRELIRRFDKVPGVDRDISVVRAGFRLASGDPAPATPPPGLGADTDAILAELGLTSDEIDAMRREKVI